MSEHEDQETQPKLIPPVVITVKPKDRTPKEQSIIDISGRIHTRLRETLTRAATLAEFIFAYNGIGLRNSPGSDAWMWDYGEPTEEDVFEFYRSDALKKEAERDAKVVEELEPALQATTDDHSNIQIILKRIRDNHGYYKYAVLAQFPKGVQAENPILGWTPLELTQTDPDTIFFRPTAACVLHACDDLYKIHRQEVFKIPYRTREEAIKSLQHDEWGMNEYQLRRTAEETVKQDAENYITVGLQSAFNNEPYVVPVSRFWASQKEK